MGFGNVVSHSIHSCANNNFIWTNDYSSDCPSMELTIVTPSTGAQTSTRPILQLTCIHIQTKSYTSMDIIKVNMLEYLHESPHNASWEIHEGVQKCLDLVILKKTTDGPALWPWSATSYGFLLGTCSTQCNEHKANSFSLILLKEQQKNT